jgi:solute carrier family 25 (mitochondrial uncoupling protein), member 8/9
LPSKIAAGLLSGAIGITVATPTDLVKVRFQAEGPAAPGHTPKYSGVMNAYATIVRQEGLLGLWTGLGPNIIRNSVINATELVSYDTAKEVRFLDAQAPCYLASMRSR